MKKSKIILISAMALGVAIVGTTFAAYAVTDNANPFGVKVTPGELSTDSKTVSLAWGDSTHMENVNNLALNTETSLGTVELLASTSDAGSYQGAFKMTLSDYTERSAQYDGAKLIDYLQVTAYANEQVELRISSADEAKSKTQLITVPHNSPKALEVKVLLPNSASTVYDQIKNDIVYIEFDWGKGSEQDTEATDVYFYNASNWEDVYCYAFDSANTNSMNNAWPGIQMVSYNSTAKLFKYTLATKYDTVIFNDGQSGEGHQTVDITVSAEARTTHPVYKNGNWITLAAAENSLADGFYLVGTMNNWTASQDYKFEANPASEGEYKLENITVAAGTEYKVLGIDNSVETWYGTAQEGNITIEDAGTYNFYFKPAGGNQDWPGYAAHYVVGSQD